MFLSRAKLCPGAVFKRGIGPWDDYKLHQWVWRLFGDEEKRSRDFLYRLEEGTPVLTVWTVSQRPPLGGHDIWEVEKKLYDPVLERGDRLAFLLRANPVRTVQGKDDRHARHDVVMDAKMRLRNSGIPKHEWPALHEIVQDAAFAWLAARQERGGFAVKKGEVTAESYRERVFYKKGARIKIATVDFRGQLTVTNRDAFRSVLFGGIGPAKGFGCGLMLIRRVG